MQLRPLPVLLFISATAAVAQSPQEQPAPNPKLKAYDPGGGAGKKLFEVPIEGTIDLGLAPFVDRVIEQAQPGDVVVLKIKTFGGRIDAAVRIRDALLDSKARTVAYIDHRAISAGALIALATDTIIMSPGASIGAATPVEIGGEGEMKATSEKVVSYMRAEMRATAEAKGRRGDIAEAMVDADIEVKGVNEKGKLVTLTGDRALELGIADAVAPDYAAALALLNLGAAERVRTETDWGEKVARLLTDPVVSSLLMSFGVLGLLMEFYTGGHGIGGAVGLICLGLFFFGQYAAHLAGWEEILLFGIGMALLLVEIFLIPGFGVAGIAGIACMTIGLGMALVEFDLPLGVSFELGYIQEAVQLAAIRIAAVILVLIAGTFVFSKYLPRTQVGGQLILQSAVGSREGYVGTADQSYLGLLGHSGRAVGALRPAGIADFSGRRVDVVTEGDFVEAGSLVKVILVDGNRVVVKKIVSLEGEGGASA